MKNALLTTAIVLFLNDEDGALRAKNHEQRALTDV